MLGDITVEATVDLEYYRDDVIDALQLMTLMMRWNA